MGGYGGWLGSSGVPGVGPADSGEDWQRLSAGPGSKGPRLYDWSRVSIRPGSEASQGHWLLVGRSIADPEDRAYYGCYGLGDTPLAEPVRVAVRGQTAATLAGVVAPRRPALIIQWSGWRRRRQARARLCHYKRRFSNPSTQARL